MPASGGCHRPPLCAPHLTCPLLLHPPPGCSEIVNELIYCTRKGGRISVIGAYAGYANHFNIGAVSLGSAARHLHLRSLPCTPASQCRSATWKLALVFLPVSSDLAGDSSNNRTPGKKTPLEHCDPATPMCSSWRRV